VLAQAMKRRRARTTAFMALSQIGIQYRKSPLSRTLAAPPEAPQAGDRFPWLHLSFWPGGPLEDVFQKMNDTRFSLLVFGQPGPGGAPAGFRDLVDLHVVPQTPDNELATQALSISGPAYYLIRPDGHVALAGSQYSETEVRLWFADNHVHLSGASGISYRADAAPAGLSLPRMGAGVAGGARRAS
jgi:hypothetical protein